MNLIVDTNLLLLYLVGSYNIEFIEYCRRIKKYTKNDFIKVRNIILAYQKIYITPQILAEISNLSEDIKNPKREPYLGKLIEIVRKFNEEYVSLLKLIPNKKLVSQIGFTDISIMETAKKYNCMLFTDDFPLAQIASLNQCTVINYTNIQGHEWGYIANHQELFVPSAYCF